MSTDTEKKQLPRWMQEMADLGAAERDKKLAGDQPLLPFANNRWLEEMIAQSQKAKLSVKPGEQIPLFNIGAAAASPSAAIAAPPPITVGMAIRDLGDAVMTVGSVAFTAGMEKASELAQNPRVKAIAEVAGGMAISMGASMAAHMALRMGVAAAATAIMPAAAPFLVPAAFAGFSIYKIGKSMSQAWEKTVSPAMQANENTGMGKGAAFLKAIYDNKFAVGMLLGSAAYTAFTLSGSLEGPLSAAQSYFSDMDFSLASPAMAADLSDLTPVEAISSELPGPELDYTPVPEGFLEPQADGIIPAPDAQEALGPVVLEQPMFPDVTDPAPEVDNYVMADNSAPPVPLEEMFPDVTDPAPEVDNYVMADNSAPPVTIETLEGNFRDHIDGDKVSASVEEALKRVDSDNPRVAAQALKDMGYFMYNGLGGVEMDKDKAMEYFQMAADMGNEQAIKDLDYIASLTDPSVENPYAAAQEEHVARHTSQVAESINYHAAGAIDLDTADPASGGTLLPEEYSVEILTNEEALERSLDGRDYLIYLAQNGGTLEEMNAAAGETYIRAEHMAEVRAAADAAGRPDLAAAMGERIGADIGPQGADLIGETNGSAVEISARGRDALIEAAQSGASPDDVQHIIQQQGYIQNQDINRAMTEIRAGGNPEFADKIGEYYGVKPENYQVNFQPSGSEVRDQFNEAGFRSDPEPARPTLANSGRTARPDIYSY